MVVGNNEKSQHTQTVSFLLNTHSLLAYSNSPHTFQTRVMNEMLLFPSLHFHSLSFAKVCNHHLHTETHSICCISSSFLSRLSEAITLTQLLIAFKLSLSFSFHHSFIELTQTNPNMQTVGNLNKMIGNQALKTVGEYFTLSNSLMCCLSVI